jgi:hypothetical protein
MGYTPLGAGSQRDNDAPSDYVNPPQMINHLLLIWPVWYEPVTITKYPRQDGRPSDAVYVDIVDLSLPDENGFAGKVMKQAKWTQGRLIRDTKGACGTLEPMLVQMTRDGDAYQLIEQGSNPGSVQLADAWRAAHPSFTPSEPGPLNQQQNTPAPAAPAAPIVDAQASRESATMDRLRRQAQQGYGATPPPPPPPPMQEEQPPF